MHHVAEAAVGPHPARSSPVALADRMHPEAPPPQALLERLGDGRVTEVRVQVDRCQRHAVANTELGTDLAPCSLWAGDDGCQPEGARRRARLALAAPHRVD